MVEDFGFVVDGDLHRLVQRALRQAAHVLLQEPWQVTAQLYARLMAVRVPAASEFRDHLGVRLSGLIPVWPAVAQADTPLLFRMRCGWRGSLDCQLLTSVQRLIFGLHHGLNH
jgi:hypothetical protein